MSLSTDDRGRAGSAMPGYETRDVNTGAVIGFLVFLAVVLGLVQLGAKALFRHYSISEQQPAPASTFFDARQIPVEPDLQVNPRADLLKAYAPQQRELETYAWEDRQSGMVRIPIERAMDLLLLKGLPVFSEGAETKASGNSAKGRPGETTRATHNKATIRRGDE